MASNPKVMQTWASVMRQRLVEASRIADGAAKSPADCARIGELLFEAAALLRTIAERHANDANTAVSSGLVAESDATVAMMSLSTPDAAGGGQ